jgi:hypothetical protein
VQTDVHSDVHLDVAAMLNKALHHMKPRKQQTTNKQRNDNKQQHENKHYRIQMLNNQP